MFGVHYYITVNKDRGIEIDPALLDDDALFGMMDGMILYTTIYITVKTDEMG